MKIRIIIVDDYNIFRSGLHLLLEKSKKLEVIGEALDSTELFKILKSEQPDVILLNLTLPHKQILTIIKKLHKKYPDIPYVLLTYGANELVVLESVVNGARGILWKESTIEQLHESIETVYSGERFLDIPESKLTSRIIHHVNSEKTIDHNFAELSEREEEVLLLFAEGFSYKSIGEQLNISPRTVESHKNNILSKLDLYSVVDMVKYAIKHSLIEI